MSKWLGTREDQALSARLAERIAGLFPERPSVEAAQHFDRDRVDHAEGWVSSIEGLLLISKYQLARRG